MCGIFGGFAGPYYMGWMRELTGSYAVAIGSLCVLWLIAAGCMVWLTKPRRANVTKVNENLMNVRPEVAE
jgi:nitrate/nitrite transporter NarK